MSASTTKALSLAIVAAVWAIVSHLGKINLQLWPVFVGLACFLGAGGGVAGLQKSLASTISGVVWAAVYIAVVGALGRQEIVDALVLGAAVSAWCTRRGSRCSATPPVPSSVPRRISR